MAKTLRRKQRSKDRPAIADAIAKLRACDGFIMVLDMPCSNRQTVEEFFRRGEAPPSELRVFASQEFQPASKTMRALAEILQGMWMRHGQGASQPPMPHSPMPSDPQPMGPTPIALQGRLESDAKGNIHLAPHKLQHITFATDDNYQDGPISILAIEEDVPPGTEPGNGTQKVAHTCTATLTAEQAQADFPALEIWARERVGEIAGKTGWGADDVAEMVNIGLGELRKAWEHEKGAA